MQKEKFLNRAASIHIGYEYFIDENTIKATDVVKVKCNIHNIKFNQKVYIHLNGSTGCKKCYIEKIVNKNKIKKEDFIERANDLHKEYDYSKVIIVDSKTPVEVICKKHGSFFPTPSNHLNGSKCPTCSKINRVNKQRISYDEFIKMSKVKYNDEFIYHKPLHFDFKMSIKATCKKHGIFMLNPERHLKQGTTCPTCSNENKKISIDEFIKRCNNIHNFKYDYSLVNYNTLKDKIKIICPVHGVFLQHGTHHLHKRAVCKECTFDDIKNRDVEEFIKTSNLIFNSKYDYTKSIYKNKKTKLNIVCPVHGTFLKSPLEHLKGSGCPVCKESKGELKIRDFFSKNKISFIAQKKFEECRYKKQLQFDFYLPDYNICIEYDGAQHSEIIEAWGGIEKLKETQYKDNIKNDFCNNNNIGLIRIKYTDYNNIEVILTEKLNIMTKSKSEIENIKFNKLISKMDIAHDFKYQYISINEYKNLNSFIEIVCPKHNTSFSLKAFDHLNYGKCCIECDEYKVNKTISIFLKKNKIEFIRQHKFDGCKNKECLPFDFYIPHMRCCIEFDGEQHYKPLDFFGGIEAYEKLKVNDAIKTVYCEENFIDLIRIKFTQIDKINEILSNYFNIY